MINQIVMPSILQSSTKADKFFLGKDGVAFGSKDPNNIPYRYGEQDDAAVIFGLDPSKATIFFSWSKRRLFDKVYIASLSSGMASSMPAGNNRSSRITFDQQTLGNKTEQPVLRWTGSAKSSHRLPIPLCRYCIFPKTGIKPISLG